MSAPKVGDRVRHDPTWLHAGRWGRWCHCSCGWKSRNGTVMFAQLAFGQHLMAVPTTPDSTPRSDAGTTGAPVEGHAANGPQSGGKR